MRPYGGDDGDDAVDGVGYDDEFIQPHVGADAFGFEQAFSAESITPPIPWLSLR
jgi:hypothetical protein